MRMRGKIHTEKIVLFLLIKEFRNQDKNFNLIISFYLKENYCFRMLLFVKGLLANLMMDCRSGPCSILFEIDFYKMEIVEKRLDIEEFLSREEHPL